jgi:FAD:protein FMN transferase
MNNTEKKSEKIEFRALGTDVFLEIVLDEADQKKEAIRDLDAAKKIFFEKEKIFSRFDPESELSCLNKKLGVWQKVSRDISYLSRQALYYNKIGKGLYDPRIIEILEGIGYEKNFRSADFSKKRIPVIFEKLKKDLSADLKIRKDELFLACRMDFSGIAKGYIVDWAAEFLKKKGWRNFLVDAGGDMSVSGLNSEGKKWKIAVEGVSEEKLMLEISNRGIATSGISRKKWTIAGKKFHHLVNPQKPNHFSYELRTVSVISKNTESADGRAKTLVLMGKKRGFEFSQKNKIAAVFLDYRGDVTVTSEAKKYIFSKQIYAK